MLNSLHFDGYETVADLGCGAGVVTENLLARVPHGRVVAVDSSLNMLEAARRRLGSRVDFVHADPECRVRTRPGVIGGTVGAAAAHVGFRDQCGGTLRSSQVAAASGRPYLNDSMDLLGRPNRLLYVRLNAEASVGA